MRPRFTAGASSAIARAGRPMRDRSARTSRSTSASSAAAPSSQPPAPPAAVAGGPSRHSSGTSPMAAASVIVHGASAPVSPSPDSAASACSRSRGVRSSRASASSTRNTLRSHRSKSRTRGSNCVGFKPATMPSLPWPWLPSAFPSSDPRSSASSVAYTRSRWRLRLLMLSCARRRSSAPAAGERLSRGRARRPWCSSTVDTACALVTASATWLLSMAVSRARRVRAFASDSRLTSSSSGRRPLSRDHTARAASPTLAPSVCNSATKEVRRMLRADVWLRAPRPDRRSAVEFGRRSGSAGDASSAAASGERTSSVRGTCRRERER
mmetsp:Transcript_16918/g.49003  ORF Transcript_16918/g.49003 Transcript_16918/m.49003 type:complete len:325 (+) Transcript_16918:925-1899(+)